MALTRHSDVDERNRIAESVFKHIAGQPEPLGFSSLFVTACTLQEQVQPGGAQVIISALQGDADQHQRGLALLPHYLRVQADDNVRDALIPALAPILATSQGEILHLLVDLLKTQGWTTDSAIVTAAQQAIEGLKGNRSKEARADRAVLSAILPRKGKRSLL